MKGYVLTDRWRSPDFYQRTYSYRSHAPRGAVTSTQLHVAAEERLEESRSPLARMQLYSDLYAETESGETYNSEDLGHVFVTQTWRCRPLNEVGPEIFPTYWNKPSSYKDLLPNDALVSIADLPASRVALGPLWKTVKEFPDIHNVCPPQVPYDLMGSRINDILWAQCPDDIRGSLGQDVVDVMAFGKLLDNLLSLQRAGESLSKQFLKFSAKKRRAIDSAVRAIRSSPRASVKLASRYLGGTYLSWLFQYLPWLEDMQTLLSAATKSYLWAVGRTRKRTIHGLGEIVKACNEQGVTEMVYWPQSGTKRTIFYNTSQIKPCAVSQKLSCSVVSYWTQNFEHGALEPLVELNKQLGLVYPSLVWDLIPWSWLIDWFVKIGDLVDRSYQKAYGEWNCSYAYVTSRYVASLCGMTYTSTARWHTHPGVWDHCPVRSDLSPSQWSILAALGLSHRN